MLGAINADAEHPVASQIKMARVRREAMACCCFE